LAQSGGADGVRDLGAIQSALTQPQMTFGGEELYPTVEANIERDLLFVGVEPPVH
jgi:prophage maintenance system killer protein